MKNLNKIYYLDRNSDSKRNIPDHNNFLILHIKGYGSAMSKTIGCYEMGEWIEKGTQRVVHPYGYSELIDWVDEHKEETPELFEGALDALNKLSIMGKDQ